MIMFNLYLVGATATETTTAIITITITITKKQRKNDYFGLRLISKNKPVIDTFYYFLF